MNINRRRHLKILQVLSQRIISITYIIRFNGSGQYYFPLGEAERFFPYVGLGLGANYNDYVVYYNIYSDRDKAFGFLARPKQAFW